MAKREDKQIELVDNEELELQEIPREELQVQPMQDAVKVNVSRAKLINCLRNERIIVKHIDKQTGLIKDPKHVLYGGMAETAKRTYTVPILRSGAYVDVLTKDEKAFLEQAMGLEANALSVYIKGDKNFWSTANPKGIATVTLMKHDNYLDLSNPIDYIKYKILLANKDRIAESLQKLQDQPKATYEFVLVSDVDRSKMATAKLSYKKQAYKILGKIEDDADVLRFIIETLDGRPTAKSSKLEMLQVKAEELIQSNASLFVKTATDELLPNKVLIRKAVEEGIITKRGNYHYLRADNTPLCNNDQEPTLNIAAMFLNEPKHQELKFAIEAKLNQVK